MSRKEVIGNGLDMNNWYMSNTQANISNDHSYSLFNLATPGCINLAGDNGYKELDIVISEIAWAGTDLSANDEWFELYNNTDSDINLAGWSVDGNINIELYGIIPAHKHYLMERTDDTSVPGKNADIIYTGSLNNTGAVIRLLYNYRETDCVDMLSGWAAGSSSPRISMERIDISSPGTGENWQNGPGDIEGAETSEE